MSPQPHARDPLLPGSHRAILLLALPLLLFLVVPVIVLFAGVSPALLARHLAERETAQAVALSLATTLLALLITITLGTPLALWLAARRARAGAIIDAAVDLPMFLPPAVAGLALLITLGRRGPVGALLASLGIDLAFTPAAVVAAQVFVSAPFYIRAARAGFASIDPELLQAAAIDGATGMRRVRRIIIPLATPALAAGATLAWARSLGEFGATIIFAGSIPGRTQTMPLAIYLGFESSLDRAVVLAALLIILAIVSLAAARLLAGPTRS